VAGASGVLETWSRGRRLSASVVSGGTCERKTRPSLSPQAGWSTAGGGLMEATMACLDSEAVSPYDPPVVVHKPF